MAVDAVPAVVSTPSVRSRGSIREKKRLVCLWKRLSRTPGTVAAKEMADTDVLSFPCSVNNNIINNPTSPYPHSSGHFPPVFADKVANQESTSACGCSHVSGSLEKQCSKASSSSSSLARRMPSLLLPVGRGGFWSSTSAPTENFSLGWSARLIQPNEESRCTGEAVTGTRSCSPMPTPPREGFDATSPSGDFDVCGGKVCGRVVETSSSCSTPMSTITVDRSRGREGPVGSPSGVGGRGGHRVVVDGGADDCHGGDGTGSSCCCSRVADDAGVSGVSESSVSVEGDLFARSVGGGVELPNDSTMGPQQQQKYHHRNHRQRHRGIPSSRSWYWWTMFLYFSFFMVATVDAQLRPNTHARNTKDDGVCRSIDVRNSVDNLEILRNCSVVEGFVQILLIDHAGEDHYANISFPKLREITGYLVLYRVNGLRTLENLFPNLSVIRGHTLFFNYALVVFEMMHMQRIGLPSLTDIMRGAVRIEKNPNLCFVDTIDWDMIAKAGKGEHFIKQNKQSNQCPKCAAHSKCPTSPVSNVTLCWNGTMCQKVCPEKCEGSCDENGECCHEMCRGGCSGRSSEDCFVCKKVVFGKDCLSECPANTYEYLNRRCIDSKECLEMPPPVENDIRGGNSWKIFNRTCIYECPPGFVSVNNNSCERCNSSCRKECPGANIDSIAAAEELRGCTYIKGALEIQIRGGIEEGGKNIVKELENNLQMIEEIEDYLKIVRSFPLVSLNFLKNLTVIHGKKLEHYKYSLVVVENQNLQELWDRESKKEMVKILNGRPFFHFNPKLCISKIDQIKQPNFTDFTDLEVARNSNGDKVPCNVSDLKVKVTIKTSVSAVITWDAFKHHDPRSLLGYVVYLKAAPTQNVTLYDGRDACGGDGWHVYDVDPDGNLTENTHIITYLTPYTQYAFYVRTYTIATETVGAQSKIHYFRTEPDEPSKPQNLKVFSNSSHELIIQWMPPKYPNGNLTHYKIIGKWEEDGPELLKQRDYCVEPLTLPDKKPGVTTLEEDKKADKDTCACDEKNKKINKQIETERQFQIRFENFLHNKVYVKRNRNRRDIRDFAEDGDLRSGYSNIQLLKEKDYLSNRDVLSYGDDEVSNTSPSPSSSQPPPDIELNVVGIKHVIRELRNFAKYTITVQACREMTDREKRNLSSVKSCSPESIESARTLKLDGADDVDSKSLAIDVFNETAGSVRLRWKEPEKPNGIIVTYQIEYRRVDIENYKPVVECITRRHYQENGNSYTLKNLQPGKYKLRLRATSLAGNGAYTKLEEFDIKESTSSPVEDKLVYVITGAFISITLTIIIMILFKRKFGTKVPNMKLIASVNPEYVSAVYIPDEWEVARKKIELLRELGQGSFGMVYEGIARDVVEGKPEIRCAIKTVNEHATDRERIEFLNEASVMKAFNTHHVVQLLGVVSQGQPTLVVMELMANGDLKTYLRSHRPDTGVDHGRQPPTLKRILQMAIEIADGMAYLAAKKFVHRDLAARNCMVADDLTVKIGDFGMTRDIYETDYYRKGTKGLLPVRWMAPESLKDGVFTSFSDVWSYGVVLWEMATLASQPYQGLSNDQVLRYVIDGGVMERPENCPDKLYELMRICWQHKPVHRPTFLTLVSMLETDASPSFVHVSFYHSQEAEELRNHDTAQAVPRAACIPIQGARIAEIEDDDDEEEEVGVVQTPTTPLRLTRDVEDFSVGGDSGSDASMDEEGGEQDEGEGEGRKEFSHRSERKGSGDEGGAKMHGGGGSSSGRWASMGGDGSKGMSVYSSDSSKGSKVSNGSAAANGYVMGRHNSFGVLKTTEC